MDPRMQQKPVMTHAESVNELIDEDSENSVKPLRLHTWKYTNQESDSLLSGDRRESKSGSQDRDNELTLCFYSKVMVLTQRLLDSCLKKYVESLEDDMS